MTEQNLQYRVDTLNDAHDALRDWQSVIHRALICGPEQVEVFQKWCDNQQCSITHLTQWLADNHAALPQHRLSLQKIQALHQQVTDAACVLLQQRLEQPQVDCAAYTDFEQRVGQLDQAIWRLQSELHFLLFSRDSLTGLPTRRELNSLLPTAIQAAREEGQSVYLCILDIDHFKPINDAYGHHIGDQALRMVSDRIQRVLRRDDTLFRYGGEEFVLLLSHIDCAQTAQSIAERARVAVCQQPLSIQEHNIEISASFGLACVEHVQQLDAALSAADIALYRAKNQGRNQVCLATSDDYEQPKTAVNKTHPDT